LLKRFIEIDCGPKESFFLWGPRQAGKSTLLSQLFPNAYRIDLLEADKYIELTERPHLLRETLLAMDPRPERVVIDEIQKIPALLDEVHLMIERSGISFALCGSSARKLKRGHANLLGGRGVRY